MCEKHKLADKLEPKKFEEKRYQHWEEKGYFRPSEDRTKRPYTIVIPPPNITGRLHMGHALDDTIQDILIRYKRMSGYNALWIPGTDHAAIATEAKIVAKLKEEGIQKEELGREEFLKRAWEWKEEYGGAIVNQIKKLGCSCDWSRERFTMDEGLSKAVQKFFLDLYQKGLIYKGKRMINWCTYCNTSISDAEVEYEEEPTHLWHLRYQITGTKDQYVVIATTRPETMLGDTAVAVHPEDERYQHLIGKTCLLPIVNKEIPIIADEFVEKEFGTGCVKITPAHDPNDYQAGLKHHLEMIDVFDENGFMNDLVPEFEGLGIEEAREKIVEKLKQIGALVKIEDYTHNVGKCYRCHHTIEPKISEQWFVKMKPLAEPALKAVKEGTIQFVPERFSKIYYNWMENIQDWCISRQLWWGHRIPAYYCDDCYHMMVTDHMPKKCEECGSTHLHQDEDTLDTWFSSALWPFSTLGWPEKNKDLDYFYPTATLVTAYDIIFFWVARMIVAGLEETKQKPFDHILIHGIVRDSQGRKMSKSLGNGIDPLDIIEKYSTDSLRFSLISGITPGNDIRYMPEKLEAASNFSNKLWNASRFVLMNLEEDIDFEKVDKFKLEIEDKWILAKLNQVAKEVNLHLDQFELGIALQKIYDFIWNEFCDWYIEIVKTRLYDKENPSRRQAQWTLNKVLTDALKLLHPFMPFITEEIYTKLYDVEESIMISSYPIYEQKWESKEEVKNIEKMKEAITEIRNVRAKMNVPPSKKAELIVVTKEYEQTIEKTKHFIQRLGYASKISVKSEKENISPNAICILLDGLEIYIPLEDLVNIEEEQKRLQEEIEKYEKERIRAKSMLSNPGFTQKAPEQKIKEEEQKVEKYEELIKSSKQRLEMLGK